MSISTLQDPTKAHDVLDDIESCFWVLLYTALHYFKVKSGGLDLRILDECNEHVVNGKFITTGGLQKLKALGKDIRHLEFESRPLTSAIRAFAKVLSEYHDAKEAYEKASSSDNDAKATQEVVMEVEGIDDKEKQEREERRQQYLKELEEDDLKTEDLKKLKRKYDVTRRHLEGVYAVRDELDEALAMADWPKGNDAVQDQHPKKTANAERKALDKTRDSQQIEAYRQYREGNSGVFPAIGLNPLPMALHSSIGEKRRQPHEPTDDDDRGEGPSNSRAKRSRPTRAPVTPPLKPLRARKPRAERLGSKSKSRESSRSGPRTRSQDSVRTVGSQNQDYDGVRTRSRSRKLGLIN